LENGCKSKVLGIVECSGMCMNHFRFNNEFGKPETRTNLNMCEPVETKLEKVTFFCEDARLTNTIEKEIVMVLESHKFPNFSFGCIFHIEFWHHFSIFLVFGHNFSTRFWVQFLDLTIYKLYF